MRMPIEFWHAMVADVNTHVCATRYSTDNVPDAIFWLNGSMWRGTWSKIDNAPDFWFVPLAPSEFLNIAPTG